ncbi:hypothetical protein DRP98_08355 [candidate division KSB1 bacterium]|nr:MAG: hypothetical protein DRP98_08355 [candidate division KSB1 bacterium]
MKSNRHNTGDLKPKFLQHLHEIFVDSTDILSFWQGFKPRLQQLIPFENYALFLWEAESQSFVCFDINPRELENMVNYQLEEGIVDWLFSKSRPCHLRDFRKMNYSEAVWPEVDHLILFPLTVTRQPVGFLEIAVPSWDEHGSKIELALTQLLCDLFASSVARFRLSEHLEHTNKTLGNIKSQLLHAGKLIALGELTSGIAHEVNNPLTTILGRIQILMMNKTLPQALIEKLKIVENETKRVAQIIRQLLNFSRRNSEQVDTEVVDINATILNSLQLTRHALEVEGIDVEIKLNENLRQVLGDSNQLQQVFINLITNAKQAMSRGGKLKISSEMQNGFVKIVFSDTGCGIPIEFRNKIFEPFFTTKLDNGGTGLGLAISKEIIEKHRGKIQVRSAKNRGTTFIIKLPVNR